MSASEDYVLLGLRLGRHVDGLVDSYCGPAELREQVDAEPLAEPAALVAEGEALLAQLEDGWLRDQALGLRPTPACSRAKGSRTRTRSSAATACGPSA